MEEHPDGQPMVKLCASAPPPPAPDGSVADAAPRADLSGARSDRPDQTSTGSKRMLRSSQGERVIGALLEIRSMPVAA